MKIIIAALGENRVIGDKDKMPWWVPEEYQQFLNLIKDQTVIMGRKTYEIFSKDLPSQRNLVVSRGQHFYPRAEIVPSLEAALYRADQFSENIFIAGGATIYEHALPFADKMYLSWIKGDYAGDTWFPEFDERDWHVEHKIEHDQFNFVIYKKNICDDEPF